VTITLYTATNILSVYKTISLPLTTSTCISDCILQNESQTQIINMFVHTTCHDNLQRLTQK